jgi:hypothetical protein
MQTKPDLNQIYSLADILTEKQWVKTQFGEDNLRQRIANIVKTATIKQYKYILFSIFKGRTDITRKLLLELGLKPVPANF